MKINRLKKISFIKTQTDHSNDLVYQLHICPKFLVYIDDCMYCELDTISFKGQVVRGNGTVGDQVSLRDCNGIEIGTGTILSLEIKQGTTNMADGGEKITIVLKGIGEEGRMGQLITIQ